MKTMLFGVTLVSLLALLPAAAAGAGCAALPDSGACPIKLGEVSFDRCFGSNPFSPEPTQIGNQACKGVKDLNALAQSLGNNANKAIQDAERDARAALKVIGKNAINPNAIADYNKASAFVKDIRTDFDRFLADPQCGSKASLDGLKLFFQSQMQNIVAVGAIGGKLGDAALKTAPVVAETGKILGELAGLAGDVANAGPAAKKRLDALTKALLELQNEARQIATLNLAAVAGDGVALVSTVGPFLGECAGCATSMASALGAFVGGSTAAGTGAVACPETAVAFGGSCWATVGGVPVALSSPLIAAVGSAPCNAMTADLAKMQEYVSRIQRFVDSSVKLVQSVRNSLTALVTASDALVKLGQELGRKSEPRLRNIETSVNTAIVALNQASAIVEDEVAPKVARLGGALLTQIGTSTQKLVTCYGKMQDTAEKVSGEAGEAMVLYIAAGALLVDGGKVLNNIGTQGQIGIDAARSTADSEWKKIDKDRKDIYKDIWGTAPPTFDLGQASLSFGKLFGDENHRDKVLADIGAAALRLVSLPDKVLNAGKNAFLNLPNARPTFDQAAVKAHASLVKFQAQTTASKGRRFLPPNIATGPLTSAKTSLVPKTIARVTLGPLPAKLDRPPGKLDAVPVRK